MIAWFMASRVGRALAGLLAAAGLLLGVYAAGKRDGRQRAEQKAAEGYIKTRERMDEADVVGDDPAVLREWLRKRGGE